SDYEQQMEYVENMIHHVVEQVFGGPTFEYQGHTIDVTPPWPRQALREAIIERSGIDYTEYPEAEDLIRVANEKGANIEAGTVWPRAVDELLKHFVRPFLIQPQFLTDYPVELSPLAKKKPD